jgi:hypothetical protein
VTLLATDLRGNETASRFAEIEKRAATLESTNIPERVFDLERDVGLLNETVPKRAFRSEL